jgi:hypothetical protein
MIFCIKINDVLYYFYDVVNILPFLCFLKFIFSNYPDVNSFKKNVTTL